MNMKADRNFTTSFILLVVVQVLMSNYMDFSLYIVFTIMPALILLMPLKLNVLAAMPIAFLIGLSVDFLSDGLLGLNAAALVPVALARKSIFSITQGKSSIERDDELSFSRGSSGKLSLGLLMALSIFLIIYIIADGAGTRPFWFNLARFSASLACSFILSMLTAHILLPSNKR